MKIYLIRFDLNQVEFGKFKHLHADIEGSQLSSEVKPTFSYFPDASMLYVQSELWGTCIPLPPQPLLQESLQRFVYSCSSWQSWTIISSALFVFKMGWLNSSLNSALSKSIYNCVFGKQTWPTQPPMLASPMYECDWILAAMYPSVYPRTAVALHEADHY